MSDSSNGKGGSAGSPNEGGVLANLPRTRPQRASARRVAARRSATPAPARTRKPSTAKRASAKAARAKPAADLAAAKTTVKSVTESAASTTAKAAPARAKAAAKGKRRATTRTAARKAPPAYEQAAPRQGFEGEGEAAGGSVQPPGGAELVASAAEIFGELAKAGISKSERLLKDVLSRLPLS